MTTTSRIEELQHQFNTSNAPSDALQEEIQKLRQERNSLLEEVAGIESGTGNGDAMELGRRRNDLVGAAEIIRIQLEQAEAQVAILSEQKEQLEKNIWKTALAEMLETYEALLSGRKNELAELMEQWGSKHGFNAMGNIGIACELETLARLRWERFNAKHCGNRSRKIGADYGLGPLETLLLKLNDVVEYASKGTAQMLADCLPWTEPEKKSNRAAA